MTDWTTLKDISGKFMLIRKSHVSPSLVEAFSLDNGKTEAFADTEVGIRNLLKGAIEGKTYKESGHVLSGNYYWKLRRNAGLDNPQHWINRATALFSPAAGQSQSLWNVSVQKAPRPGGPLQDYSVIVHNDVSQVVLPKWHEEVFPDGVCPVTPSFAQPGRFILIHPEQLNFRTVNQSPYYENIPQSDWREITSLGTRSNPLKWPTIPSEPMAAWLFSLSRHPTQVGRHIGLLHLEKHEHSVAHPCFKALAIAYTDDEGITFTAPQLIVSYPLFDRKYEWNWSGTGDCSSLVWHEAGQRWLLYCYTAQNGGGITVASSSDPSAKAGTWRLLKNGQFSVDALSNQPYDTILSDMSCGNPWVGYSVPLGSFLMMGSPWGKSNVLCFSTSQDGVNWTRPKRVYFDSPLGVTPLYPSLVGDGGSAWINEKARLYYADSRPDGRRKMKVRTIEIKP